jgi:hypothetical protein
MDRKKRWRLQILWGGDWRTIMESDERHMLVEYASRCADDLEMRIQDTNEDVKKNDRRH